MRRSCADGNETSLDQQLDGGKKVAKSRFIVIVVLYEYLLLFALYYVRRSGFVLDPTSTAHRANANTPISSNSRPR